MTVPALQLRGLVKSYGALPVTQSVSLDVRMGEIHALIGPNGAGKSTLMAQIAGQIKPDSGRVLLGGVDVSDWPPYRRARKGLARTFQISSVFKSMTALENVAVALNANTGKASPWRAFRTSSTLDLARKALHRLGFEGADQPAESIGYGSLRQLELSMGLAPSPSVLLLDEPLAGLSLVESAQVIEMLRGLRSRFAILLIEHDMNAVFALADRISVLVSGRVIATGTPDEIRHSELVKKAYLGGE